MAGHAKEAGPTSARVAANLKRIRQERGLSYAELARRLAADGHPILDTGLIKIEKGDRRVDVDDLVALAVALDVTPNTLLMPHIELSGVTRTEVLTGDIGGNPQELWAWAIGEVPLGSRPASVASGLDLRTAEVTFNRVNQPHRWTAPSSSILRKGPFWSPLTGAFLFTALGAFKSGMDTAEIRDIWATAIVGALIVPQYEETEVKIFEKDGQYRIEVFDQRDGEKKLAVVLGGTPDWASRADAKPPEVTE